MQRIPLLLGCMLALCLAPAASAGDVKLSNTFDYLCRVDITWGKDAPEGTPVEQHADLKKEWSITKPDKVCYRRPSTPDNCDSGMTQWKTPWKCAESTGSGVEDLAIQ